MLVKAGEHAKITKDCYLDLSGVKTISPSELAGIADCGPLSLVFKVRIKVALGSPIELLAEIFRVAALSNL